MIAVQITEILSKGFQSFAKEKEAR